MRTEWLSYPTFEDFINFILHSNQGNSQDVHWMQYWTACSPCIYDYDAIVKLESLDSDMRYLREVLNVPPVYNDIFLMPKKNNTYDSSDFFKSIDECLVLQLYERYRKDFEIFGYAKPDYVADACEPKTTKSRPLSLSRNEVHEIVG